MGICPQLLMTPGESFGIFSLGRETETRGRRRQLRMCCNFCSLGSQWTGFIYSLVGNPNFNILILKTNLC